MKKHLDFNGNEIEYSPNLTEYDLTYQVGNTEIRERHRNGKLELIFYRGISLEEVPAFHEKRFQGIEFQLIEENNSYGFSSDGKLSFMIKSSQPRENVLLEEECDAEGNLVNGTAFVMENGSEIRYAIEYGENRQFFNAFDFESGNTIPLKEVIHLVKGIL